MDKQRLDEIKGVLLDESIDPWRVVEGEDGWYVTAGDYPDEPDVVIAIEGSEDNERTARFIALTCGSARELVAAVERLTAWLVEIQANPANADDVRQACEEALRGERL